MTSRVTPAPPSPSPFTVGLTGYFLLVTLLSVPFYLLGMAGGRMPGLPLLPASALMTFVPMVAALISVCQKGAASTARATLKRGLDLRKLRRSGWVLTALLFMPAVGVLEFAALRLTGAAVPLPRIAPGDAIVSFAAFVIGATGEEVGWQGYAYPALRSRLSVLTSAAVLGSVWALWHVIPFFELGRSPSWIFWHSLSAVALRVIIVWLFENTRGSVVIAVLFHAMINLSWAIFPIAGSYYDPFITFVILALAVGVIVCLWGPITLASFGVPAAKQQDGRSRTEGAGHD